MDVVNLRHMPYDGSWAEQVETMAALQQEGLVRHVGVSNVGAEQLVEARAIVPIVCVQNQYNLAHREDDALVDSLAADGIAYVPFFPLGGFTPLQSDTLEKVAAELGETPLAVALAWLLQRSPNVLLIPGTSSLEHLRENVAGAGIVLPPEALEQLDGIAG
jgi:pyridoxine 4-dehydrogenase